MDQLQLVQTIISLILASLLIISELLGWSQADINAITQLYKLFNQPMPPRPLTPLPRLSSLSNNTPTSSEGSTKVEAATQWSE